ncbi:hypothetical protein PILCRDRAFT_828936 [Piloderma croceum F 1598]|uniref:Uncharacterized protein n=1 Tax=Piloderma croceum (strain F 1598) TaxID=765440 RepID=A0A0C3B8M1_PILCF|nr:hypothetical protein PILCRDRAFT_828936 [Piloderma croceum F 1598]
MLAYVISSAQNLVPENIAIQDTDVLVNRQINVPDHIILQIDAGSCLQGETLQAYRARKHSAVDRAI